MTLAELDVLFEESCAESRKVMARARRDADYQSGVVGTAADLLAFGAMAQRSAHRVRQFD